MLSVIRIKNFAIVEEVELEFGPGLNVITGETGAGKSIILKAIELLTGRRVSSDIVRSGAEQCIIEGLFELSASARAQLLDTADDAAQLIDGDEVLVRRVIDRSGRSKTYVNGSIVTAGLLQALTQPLLDLTGQHEHQRLLDAAEHLNLLDQFGVDAGLRQETASAYAAFAKAKKILETFKKDSEQSRRYFEHLQEEKKELDMAAIQPGERDELEQELKRLANFEALSSQVNSSLLLLEDDTEGIETRLQKLSAVLSHSAALDTELAALLPLVDSAAAQLSEARIILAGYGSSLECEPGRLEYLRERIAEIARLERKYDKKSDELLRYQQQITEAINEIGAQGFDERRLQENADECRRTLDALEQRLSAERQKVAEKLSRAVEEELVQLNMKKAKFRVEIAPAPSSANGADCVQFLLAANPGEPFLPLHKVASGGELSRILLVLKTLLNRQLSPATQIFDEIDSGIGGAIAQVVGGKLKRVSQTAQVILVTHAPQIAAFADEHFVISKQPVDSRTVANVHVIAGDDRVRQIAAMMGGKQVTANFEHSARELISQAAEFSEKEFSEGKKKRALNPREKTAVI